MNPFIIVKSREIRGSYSGLGFKPQDSSFRRIAASASVSAMSFGKKKGISNASAIAWP